MLAASNEFDVDLSGSPGILISKTRHEHFNNLRQFPGCIFSGRFSHRSWMPTREGYRMTRGHIVAISSTFTFEDFPIQERTRDELINEIVGDIERLRIYSRRGFSDPVNIPADVWAAFERPRELGIDQHPIRWTTKRRTCFPPFCRGTTQRSCMGHVNVKLKMGLSFLPRSLESCFQRLLVWYNFGTYEKSSKSPMCSYPLASSSVYFLRGLVRYQLRCHENGRTAWHSPRGCLPSR